MSFSCYIGRPIAVGPEYYHLSGEGLRQYSSCPFEPEELPFCEGAALPPPLFEQQELTSFECNRYGVAKTETHWVALFAAGALNWTLRGRGKTERGRWFGRVLFPA